jgi:hypothetical protein
MDHLVTIVHEKLKKNPTHQKFVEFCRRVSSNQVGIIRTMNKLRILTLFIVLMMPTWLDETRRQNSTNFWCVGIFSIFRGYNIIKIRFFGFRKINK